MPSYEHELREYREICARRDPDDAKSNLEKQRHNYLGLFRAFPVPYPQEVQKRQLELPLPGRVLQLHVHRRADARGPQACLLYAHGGGFIAGGLEASESISADLAAEMNITVINFSYRLAPEHPYPAAIEDCYELLLAVAEQPERYGIDATRIFFGGESCGGNFAGALPLLARDRGGPRLAGLVPVNPVFDVHRWAYREVDDCDPAFCDEMEKYTKPYLLDGDHGRPAYASPLRAADVSDLPPFFMWAAQVDPLSKEALAFADRLTLAGVPCRVAVQPDIVHGALRARHHYQFAAAGYAVLRAGLRALLDGEIRTPAAAR